MSYYLTETRHFYNRYSAAKKILNLYPEQASIKMEPSERSLTKQLHSVGAMPSNHVQADLISDLFMLLYNGEAEIVDDSELLPSRKINARLIKTILGNPALRDTLTQTKGRIIPSISAAVELFGAMKKDPNVDKQFDQQEGAALSEDTAMEIQKDIDNMSGYDKDNELKTQEDVESLQSAIDTAMKTAEAYVKPILESLEKVNDNPFAQGKIAAALKEAEDVGEDANSMLKMWGSEEGGLTLEDSTEILRIIQQGDFDKISKLVGRMMEASTNAMENVVSSYTGQVSEARMTSDISRLFPISRAYLSKKANPVLRGMAVNQLVAGGGLMGWGMKSEGKERGGALWYIDRSGSMERNQLIAAVAIALGSTRALMQGNKSFTADNAYYEITPFESSVNVGLRINSESSALEHLRFSKIDSDGGTNFDEVFKDMVKRIQYAKSKNIKGLDLVIVTDGQCMGLNKSIVDDLVKAKQDMHCRLIYIQIGSGQNHEVTEISDTFVEVSPQGFIKDPKNVATRITTAISKHLMDGYGSKKKGD